MLKIEFSQDAKCSIYNEREREREREREIEILNGGVKEALEWR